MKLSLLNDQVGHWQVVSGYPNSLVKHGGTKSLSFLVDPAGRKKFFKKKRKRS